MNTIIVYINSRYWGTIQESPDYLEERLDHVCQSKRDYRIHKIINSDEGCVWECNLRIDTSKPLDFLAVRNRRELVA